MTRYLENRGWDRADANPLQDVLDAKRKIEEGAGFRPTVLVTAKGSIPIGSVVAMNALDTPTYLEVEMAFRDFTGRIKCSEPNLSQ